MTKKIQPIRGGRRLFLKSALAGGAAASIGPLYPALAAAREVERQPESADVKPFELDEITISELQDGMKSGKFTARSLVEKYSGAHRGDR